VDAKEPLPRRRHGEFLGSNQHLIPSYRATGQYSQVRRGEHHPMMVPLEPQHRLPSGIPGAPVQLIKYRGQ
jgi:hypothetical protein